MDNQTIDDFLIEIKITEYERRGIIVDRKEKVIDGKNYLIIKTKTGGELKYKEIIPSPLIYVRWWEKVN